MIKHIVLIAASLVMIYPLLWMVVSSFRPTEVIFRTPGLWLNDLYIQNYTEGWYALSYPFGQYIINSADRGDRGDRREPVCLLPGRVRVRPAEVPA